MIAKMETSKFYTRELLASLGETKFFRAAIKAEAIRKIKNQPFFGKSGLPEVIGDKVKIRRPVPYLKTGDK